MVKHLVRGRTSRTMSTSCWQRVRRLTVEQAYEFCLVTGLHGYKYIVLPGMHFVERLFWVIGVTAATVAAVYMMAEAVRFNHSHPTITAVDTTYWPTWEVDAPAVTVCPANQMERNRAQTLARRISRLTNFTTEEIFNGMPLLVELLRPRRPTEERRKKLVRLQSALNLAKINVTEAMQLVSTQCSDFLVRCRWKRKYCRTCNDLFRRVPTPHGYCCSFNYMDLSRLNYTPPSGGCVGLNEATVQTLSGCGYTNGLSVVAHIDRKQYMASLLASYAIRVFVHNPLMYPDANAEDNLVSPSTVTFLGFSPIVVSGSDRLRNLMVPQRRCVFPNEAFLPRFPNYTYNNCMASCRANFSYQLCGCVPFYFPRFQNSPRVCDLTDVECLATLDHSWILQNTSGDTDYKVNGSLVCKLCWPLCSNVLYNVETTFAKYLDSQPLNREAPLFHGLANYHDLAVFHVFVNDLVATKYKTDLYFTWISLLGALGGLSGLFVGFSLVSGLELIYFFIIRLFFRFRSESKDLRRVNEERSSPVQLPVPKQVAPRNPEIAPPGRSVFF